MIVTEVFTEMVRDEETGRLKSVAGERLVDRPDMLPRDEAIALAEANLRREAILVEMDALDAKSIRPLRDRDSARLAAIDHQLEALRAELLALPKP